MNAATMLILFPLLVGLGLLVVRSDGLRRWIVGIATGLIAAGSIALTAGWSFALPTIPRIGAHAAGAAMMCLEAAMGLYIIWVGIRQRRPLIVLLILVQLLPMTWWELRHTEELHAAHNLAVDRLAAIMALINGIVGGSICLYAIGYMREYHGTHHPECEDRRPFFFFLLFVFLGSMFGVVFANNLIWLYFFWEVTTLCSFLLIAYRRTGESVDNALRALTYNLIGGAAFAAAIPWFFRAGGSIELGVLIKSAPAVALAPAALLAFAGITKAAQFPFARWLLGAMVAPTPVSALLHSSSMVKAGVYLVIRLAPVLQGTKVGVVVALVGAVSFATASFAAVGTSDAKKVLAYSTVANLGLIILCGGIGTHEAVWAGVLLIVFHAVAKCLLFLCVGVVEHKLHSRDIESMSGLILSMPRLSIMLQIGIAGMFLAPFGMLIGKWAVLKAVVDTYPMIALFVVFGSAPTLFFWMKWMGKLLEVTKPIANVETGNRAGRMVRPVAAHRLDRADLRPVSADLLAHGRAVRHRSLRPVREAGAREFRHHDDHVRDGGALSPELLQLRAAGEGPGSVPRRGEHQRGRALHRGRGQVHEVRMANYYLAEFLNEQRIFRLRRRGGLVLALALPVCLLLP